MPERWTRAVLRFRVPILLCWLAILAVGVVASIRLPGLLSNTFTVPGTDSDRARVILAREFGERPDGVFTVVFPVAHPSDRAVRARLRRELRAAARLVPTGTAGQLQSGGGILFGDIDTTLDLQHAKGYTARLRRALPGALVTGQPAIQHDLEPVLSSDLRRGEAIALPIALLILVAVLGLSAMVLIPFVFAACTITLTLTALYVIAQHFSMVSYVTNLVELIGLGLAVDYSLLIVSRYREELDRADTTDAAIVETMATAGRAVVFSGMTVAIGLALLLLVPVPFIRSIGVGGFLVPLASIAAAATLQPVLLSFAGRRGARRVPVAAFLRSRLGIQLPVLPGTVDIESGFWARLARSIMRRPVPYLVGGIAILLACAAPAIFLRVTPGSISALPQFPESVRGLTLLRHGAGAGALTPTEIVVDAGAAGAARSKAVHAAIERLGDELFHDPEVSVVALGRASPYVAPGGRYARVIVVGRHEYGDEASQALVRRIRDTLVPAARFPAGVRVVRGRRAAAGRRLSLHVVRRVPVARARRARAHVSRAAARVPLARASAQGGAAEPALASPPCTGCSSSSSAGARARICSACTASTRSRGGSRSSCSPCCSGCRWTTRCSSCRGCASRGTRCTITSALSRTDSSGRDGSSRRRR